MLSRLSPSKNFTPVAGNHGYDNIEKTMQVSGWEGGSGWSVYGWSRSVTRWLALTYGGSKHLFIIPKPEGTGYCTYCHIHLLPENNLSLLQAIFIAHGPAFKKKHVTQPFENIQLYSLMCGELKRSRTSAIQ